MAIENPGFIQTYFAKNTLPSIVGGMRFQRFNEDTNGAKELGVFVSIGSRVYVNPPRYFLWAELQTTGELRDVVKLIQAAKKSGKYLISRMPSRKSVAGRQREHDIRPTARTPLPPGLR